MQCSKCERPLNDDNRVKMGKTGRFRGQCRPCYDARPSNTRENHMRYRQEARDTVLKAYGNACSCCGESRREFLAVDHVEGGGNEERRLVGRAVVNMMRHIIAQGFPSKYRVLCHNCNCARGAYGYCPHEREHQQVAA